VKIKVYKIIILSDVLCGCEASSLTFKEQHRLRFSKYRAAEEDIWVRRKR